MSTQGISASGNVIPQSIITMSSPYSTSVMFFPISFKPPSGIILSGFLKSLGFLFAAFACAPPDFFEAVLAPASECCLDDLILLAASDLCAALFEVFCSDDFF